MIRDRQPVSLKRQPGDSTQLLMCKRRTAYATRRHEEICELDKLASFIIDQAIDVVTVKRKGITQTFAVFGFLRMSVRQLYPKLDSILNGSQRKGVIHSFIVISCYI